VNLLRLALGAAWPLACAAALAQPTPGPRAPSCPSATQTALPHLLGRWQAQFEGLVGGAMLQLARHPEFGASVRGNVERGGRRAQVAGDVHEGEFTLEESVDGTAISATWIGDVVEGSCGREIRGTWQEGDGPIRNFVLRKRQ
jgi:hypothetical protein